MPEEILSVNPAVYNALTELQRKLQQEYDGDITISDTIDFLGQQAFLFGGLVNIASAWIKITQEESAKAPGLVDRLLEAVGARRPEDATCFVKTNVDIPLHWATTRWLTEVQGKNVIRCLYEKGREHKIKVE